MLFSKVSKVSKVAFVCLVNIDEFFSIDKRLAARGIDGWACFLERANYYLYPSYDGERLCDLFNK